MATMATGAEMVAADAALPAKDGLTDEDAQRLDHLLRGGATWEEATAALIAGRPLKLQPSAASLAAWRATIEARAAGPVYYPAGKF